MVASSNVAQQAPIRKSGSIVGVIFSWVMGLIGMVILDWFLLIVGFGVYEFFEGQANTQNRLTELLQAEFSVIQSRHALSKPYEAFREQEKRAAHKILSDSVLQTGWEEAEQTVQDIHQGALYEAAKTKKTGFLEKLQHQSQTVIGLVLKLGWAVTQLMSLRVFIFLFACPFLGGCVLLGMVDGLVKRDIRKFQSARESTFLFHRIKKTWKSAFFVPLFLYFVCPLPIVPAVFLVPMAIVLGLMVQLSLQSFKKYL